LNEHVHVTAAAAIRFLAPVVTGLVVCAFAACAAEPVAVPTRPGAPGPQMRSSAELLEAIEREIGNAACETSAQCRTIGVGAKACGGPEAYLAWSTMVSDAVRLAELVARQREARRLQVERSGRVSDCRVTPDPGAVCSGRALDGKPVCQPGKAGQGSPI
jgi:hypothetical protein